MKLTPATTQGVCHHRPPRQPGGAANELCLSRGRLPVAAGAGAPARHAPVRSGAPEASAQQRGAPAATGRRGAAGTRMQEIEQLFSPDAEPSGQLHLGASQTIGNYLPRPAGGGGAQELGAAPPGSPSPTPTSCAMPSPTSNWISPSSRGEPPPGPGERTLAGGRDAHHRRPRSPPGGSARAAPAPACRGNLGAARGAIRQPRAVRAAAPAPPAPLAGGDRASPPWRR